MNKIPLFNPQAQHEEIADEVLRVWQEIGESGQYALGPYVSDLEKAVAEYCDVPYTVATNSGTDALLLALMLNDFPAGSEIITTPYTFFATAEVIVRTGLKPVFVDIDLQSYNIDPQAIYPAITNNTKAIIPVDAYGQCADYSHINKIALDKGLTVIADAAEVFGASQGNIKKKDY